jgi:hypothetical protein
MGEGNGAEALDEHNVPVFMQDDDRGKVIGAYRFLPFRSHFPDLM